MNNQGHIDEEIVKKDLARHASQAKTWLKSLSKAIRDRDWLAAIFAATKVGFSSKAAKEATDYLKKPSPHSKPAPLDPTQEMFAEVRALIASQTGNSEKDITMDTDLLSDLGMDDLDKILLLMNMEEKFSGIANAEEDEYVNKWVTVRDIIEWLKTWNIKLIQ